MIFNIFEVERKDVQRSIDVDKDLGTWEEPKKVFSYFGGAIQLSAYRWVTRTHEQEAKDVKR